MYSQNQKRLTTPPAAAVINSFFPRGIYIYTYKKTPPLLSCISPLETMRETPLGLHICKFGISFYKGLYENTWSRAEN